MKQAFRILFLALAIVFSFGFTISEPTCQKQGVEAHQCCDKSEKDVPKKCKGCCFQITTISRIEEGVSESVGIEITNLKPIFANANFNCFNTTFLCELNPKINLENVQPFIKVPRFASIKTQTWLI